MQSKKYKVMNNLIIYFFVFTIIVFFIFIITSFLYSNINNANSKLMSSVDFSTLNMYFLETIKNNNSVIKEYGLVNENDNSSYYITFEMQDGSTNTFKKIGDKIYFNEIKLCEVVESFKVIVDKSEKETILIETKIRDKIYNMQYVL